MVRAAAKESCLGDRRRRSRATIAALLDELAANQGSHQCRACANKLAAKAFAHTAQYDAMVSAYFTGAIGGEAAPTFPG